MDTSTAIAMLARGEARRIKPVRGCDGNNSNGRDLDRALDELDAPIGRRIPAFTIENEKGRMRAIPLSYRDRTHDNAPRLMHLCSFLNRSVLPLVDPEAGLRGTFRVELHDSYTYLPRREAYANVFSFGRAVDARERDVALLPDPYHMDGFGGLVERASLDPVAWADKAPKLFFAGTTTGDRNPLVNARLRACAWGATRPDMANLHITQVAQMSLDSIVGAYTPQVAHAMMGPHAPLEAHFKHRYVLNVVGNTACWSRVPMILSTGSVMVHARHPDATWYYPLLREGRHYVAADSANGPDLERALQFCRSYDRQCKDMVREANVLARQLFSSSAPAAAYAAELLTECAWLWCA
jgi:hypothetical protein